MSTIARYDRTQDNAVCHVSSSDVSRANSYKLLKKITTIALMFFALAALSSIPKAEGWLGGYNACVINCYTLNGVAPWNATWRIFLKCQAFCLPLLFV